MIFYLIGVGLSRAPYYLQERIFRDRGRISDFWSPKASRQAAVLITCNRLEIYAVAGDLAEYIRTVMLFKSRFGYLFRARAAYVKAGKKEIFAHALRLASGLDSQLKGETQILEQIRAWVKGGLLPALIKDLWEDIIPLAENIRQETGLDDEKRNIASAVYEDLARRVPDKKLFEIIVVGTGRVAELLAEYRPARARVYFAAHKKYKRAKHLAWQTGGRALRLKDVRGRLPAATALISATSSPHRIFSADYIAHAATNRKGLLYLYDLARPCDIEPAAGRLNGIVLKNLNNSADIFERYAAGISHNIKLAEYLVGEAVKQRKEELRSYEFKIWDQAEQAGYQAS
jgi:glutamyl-tRNA reductase